MDPRAPERFVDVDVPEPGDRSLIEQRRLDRSEPCLERSASRFDVNDASERLDAEPLVEVGIELVRLEQVPRTEPAHVAVRDVRAVVERDEQRGDADRRRAPRGSAAQAARHPQVDQQRAARLEANDQVLAAAIERRDALALELGGDGRRLEWAHRGADRRSRRVRSGARRGAARAGAGRLDLRQLGHLRYRSSRATIGRAGRSLVAELVRGEHLAPRPARPPPRRAREPRRATRRGDRVAALRQADDADGVVDRRRLSSAARRRGGARRCRRRIAPSARDEAARGRADRSRRPARAAARPRSGSPPCAAIQRSYSAERRAVLRPRASARRRPSASSMPRSESASRLRARAEHELGEVGRPLAAERRDRLAHLERVPDRAARAAGPCR